MTAIPCHEAIWLRNWDDGVSRIVGPSLDQRVPSICDPKCTDALRDAQAKIGAVCAGQEAFILEGYTGKFDTDLLESGPAAVLDVLVSRTTKMCRISPVGDAERGSCMTDLHSRWNIVDGINSNGLPGLEWFLSATKSPRKEKAGMHTGMRGSGGWSERYSYWREERRFGPGRNETTCSWCTLKWFEEKLGGFREGMMVQDGEALSLPAFLRMWESAGKRCEGGRFYEIYEAAVQGYQDEGLLEEAWDQLPSGDTQYLLRHGPSNGDFPITKAREALEEVGRYRVLWSDPEFPADPSWEKQLPRLEEYASCIETFITAAKDLPCYPFLAKEELTSNLLASPSTAKELCTPACQISIDSMTRKLWESCPKARHGNWQSYSENRFFDFPFRDYLAAFRLGSEGTISLYQTSCRIEGHDSAPCAAILKQFGVEKWAFKRKPRARDLVRVTRKQLSLLPGMPQRLRDYTVPLDRHATKEENETWRLLTAWRQELKAGVCSDCVWRRFVPKANSIMLRKSEWLLLDTHESKEVAMEWIKTVHLMKDGCTARGGGAGFQDDEVEKVDEAWIRYVDLIKITLADYTCAQALLTEFQTSAFSQDWFDEAMREGREDAVWLRPVNMLPILPPVQPAYNEEQEI